MALLVHPVVAALLDALGGLGLDPLLEHRDHPVGNLVDLGVLLRGARDDQGRPRLVDQDRIDLVDDGEVEIALDELLHRVLHVVPEIIEAEFVVRAVGDVRIVGGPALDIVETVDDGSHREAQEAVDLPHPLGIALGQEVVHGDHVNALARQAVQITRQRGHQGLAFPGLHLGDLAAMKDDAPDHLDIVMTLAEGPLRGLAHGRESLGQEVVQRLAVLETLAEGRGSGLQVGIPEANETRLEGVDAFEQGHDALDAPIVARAEELAQGALHG